MTAHKIEYRIANRDGTTEARSGHLIIVGKTETAIMLHEKYGGWRVDHYASGCAIRDLDSFWDGEGTERSFANLEHAIMHVEALWKEDGYDERMKDAPPFFTLNRIEQVNA